MVIILILRLEKSIILYLVVNIALIMYFILNILETKHNKKLPLSVHFFVRGLIVLKCPGQFHA